MPTKQTPEAEAPLLSFNDFEDAGAAVAGRVDVLDDIQAWLTSANREIRAMRESRARLIKAGKLAFGNAFSREYAFDDSFRVQEASKEAWGIAERVMSELYVCPKCIELDVSRFLDEHLRLCGSRRAEYREYDEEFLLRWDAAVIRQAFDCQFPDASEAAIRQLRERALKEIGEHRPELVFTIWAHIHEPSFNGQGRMRMNYCSVREESFSAIVRYLIHLATGRQVAAIQPPTFYGYAGRSQEWERAELLKRQKKPFVGVEWLRFTADGHCELKLDPEVFARLLSQWETYGCK